MTTKVDPSLLDVSDDVPFSSGIILPKTAGKGIKLDPANPSFGWRDLKGLINYRDAGVGSPTLSAFVGNVRGPSFSAGDDYDLSYHIDHDYVPGTDLFIHLHWAHNGSNISGSLVLNYYMTYAKGHGQAAFHAEKNLTQTIAGLTLANTPSLQHRIDEVQLSTPGGSSSLLDTDLIEPDGLIEIHFDATTIPTITGSVPRPFLKFVDIHYQSTGQGTKQKAPNFYV